MLRITQLLEHFDESDCIDILKRLKNKEATSSHSKKQLIGLLETYSIENILGKAKTSQLKFLLEKLNLSTLGQKSQRLNRILEMIYTANIAISTKTTHPQDKIFEEIFKRSCAKLESHKLRDILRVITRKYIEDTGKYQLLQQLYQYSWIDIKNTANKTQDLKFICSTLYSVTKSPQETLVLLLWMNQPEFEYLIHDYFIFTSFYLAKVIELASKVNKETEYLYIVSTEEYLREIFNKSPFGSIILLKEGKYKIDARLQGAFDIIGVGNINNVIILPENQKIVQCNNKKSSWYNVQFHSNNVNLSNYCDSHFISLIGSKSILSFFLCCYTDIKGNRSDIERMRFTKISNKDSGTKHFGYWLNEKEQMIIDQYRDDIFYSWLNNFLQLCYNRDPKDFIYVMQELDGTNEPPRIEVSNDGLFIHSKRLDFEFGIKEEYDGSKYYNHVYFNSNGNSSTNYGYIYQTDLLYLEEFRQSGPSLVELWNNLGNQYKFISEYYGSNTHSETFHVYFHATRINAVIQKTGTISWDEYLKCFEGSCLDRPSSFQVSHNRNLPHYTLELHLEEIDKLFGIRKKISTASDLELILKHSTRLGINNEEKNIFRSWLIEGSTVM